MTLSGLQSTGENLIQYGFSILALSPGSKIPLKDAVLQPNGSRSATKDPARWRELLGLYPNANLGIATGEVSGITVIDFDGIEALTELAANGIPQEDVSAFAEHTLVVKTPRGRHLYVPHNPELRQTAGLLAKLDLRGDGGYVVAPPSVVDGKAYEWANKRKPRRWPAFEEMYRRLTATRQQPARNPVATTMQPNWVSELLASGAPEGQRNQSAMKLAGYFASKGLPGDVILNLLLPWTARCNPPMDRQEMVRVVEGVARYRPMSLNSEESPVIEKVSLSSRRYTWPSSGVVIRADSIHATARGIICLLTIEMEGQGTLIRNTEFLNTWSSQRAGLIRTIADMTKVDTPEARAFWQRILDVLSGKLMDAVVDDVVVRPIERPEGEVELFAIKPFVRNNVPSIIFGRGGSGKSTLAVALAVSYASGRAIVPGTTLASSGPVMFVNYETDESDLWLTFDQVCAGAGLDADEVKKKFYHVKPHAGMKNYLELLTQEIQANGIKLVVIDSVGQASGSDLTEQTTVAEYKEVLDALGVSTLTITHPSKSNPDEPYGSVYFTNYFRIQWKVWVSRLQNGLMFQQFKNTKSNRQYFEPMTLQLEFKDDSIRYRPVSGDTPAILKRLVEALSGGRAVGLTTLIQEIQGKATRAAVEQVIEDCSVGADSMLVRDPNGALMLRESKEASNGE